MYHNLDLPRFQSGIFRSAGAFCHRTAHRDTVLAAKIARPFLDIAGIGIEYDLKWPRVVPKLDKNNTAQIPPAPNPAVDTDILPYKLLVNAPAQACTLPIIIKKFCSTMANTGIC